MSNKIIVIILFFMSFIYHDSSYGMNQGQGNDDDWSPHIPTINPTHRTQEPEKSTRPKKTSSPTDQEVLLTTLKNHLHAVELSSKGMKESEETIKKLSDEMDIRKNAMKILIDKSQETSDPEFICMVNEEINALKEDEISLNENINKVNSQKTKLEKMKLFLNKKIQRLEEKMKNSEE